MVDILKEVLKDIPKEADIEDACFEGANIVLYTKSREFFTQESGLIRDIVDKIKKRIELRPSPSLCMSQEETEKKIKEITPKEAGELNIIFDPQRSVVIIESEKPGIAIGKNGEVLREIKKATFWVPLVRRIPTIKSTIIEKIRKVLYENNDYRKKFLDKVGHRIYDGWIREKKNEWVRISILGAGRQVGRSCFLLQTPESRVMLDCGIDVAAQEEKDTFPQLDAPEFDINELDAVIVSHSHIDHVGLIPYLYKLGYRGPVYMTLPARDISSLLCLDYIGVSVKDNKKAIYSSSDIKEMVKHSITLNYEEVTDITPDIRVTFYNAGHVLGSCLVHLHIGNGLHNLVYTGDLNYENSNLLPAAITRFPRLETLIIESTHAGRDDNPPTRRDSELELLKTIKETVAKKGKVLMPVLGVGRSQEVMIILEKSIRAGELEELPIYIQGLVWDITAIHTTYPDFFYSPIRKLIFHKDQNPFLHPCFKRVGSQKEMQDVLDGGPCIILATSGMLTAGASVEYWKALCEDEKNALVFTCYQGPGSLGRRLLNGEKELRLEGEDKVYKMNMGMFALSGFSGHSSRQQLMNFVRHLDPKPKKIIVVHGEPSNCLDLASSLHKLFRLETTAPKNLDVIRIN